MISVSWCLWVTHIFICTTKCQTLCIIANKNQWKPKAKSLKASSWEIHTNPLPQFDQKTSPGRVCVQRRVNVTSLAVQYPLYFHNLTRQNVFIAEWPQTARVCVCVFKREAVAWRQACVTLLSYLLLSVLKLGTWQVPQCRLSSVKPACSGCSRRTHV